MPSESTLTLFIPDLFGFQSTLSQLSKDELSQLPGIGLPVLEKWLSRGVIEKSAQPHDAVFSTFGLSLERNSDKHFAALSLLAEDATNVNFDDEISTAAYWLRADPVNMQPDRDTALLAAYEEIALTQDEANKLVAQINAHFVDEPWQLYAFSPLRWYLRLNSSTDLNTYSLDKVVGENVNLFMPSGDDADYWFNITNEVQMLLHGANVNIERDSRNMWTANSVWLWGGGCLPEINAKTNYANMITNNILYSGIAHYSGCDVLPLKDKLPGDFESGNNFIVLDSLSEFVLRRDLYTFTQKLNDLEKDVFSHCNELLETGKIKTIKLMTNDGVTVTVTRKRLHRWWKRVKPFSGFQYV